MQTLKNVTIGDDSQVYFRYLNADGSAQTNYALLPMKVNSIVGQAILSYCSYHIC